MSTSPSTPRTARSASPGDGSPEILTPGRKIRAMLAAFDSDSDAEATSQPKPSHLSSVKDQLTRREVGYRRAEDDTNEESGADDDDILVPKGRMASRLQAPNSTKENKPESAFERLSRELRVSDESSHSSEDARNDAGAETELEDDLPTTSVRHKIRVARQFAESSEDSARSPIEYRARSFSPLFVSSPARSQQGSNGEILPPRAGSDGSEDEKGETKRLKANSRFLALVAQKRKEREETERIEAEKRAARAKQLKQFSSELFSGDEGTDDEQDSGRKLTQQGRPARKASKRALEEMNRETQRMSRNMQLAHQATTKKKITKESFFARFDYLPASDMKSIAAAPPDNSSTTAGSQNSSDVEVQKEKVTPGTSPVLSPMDYLKEDNDKFETPFGDTVATMAADELGILSKRASPTAVHLNDTVTVLHAEGNAMSAANQSRAKPERKALTKPPVRVRLSRHMVAQHQKDDSDGDLEVVTSPAKCRRIAAFENLPSKKVQEPAALMKLKALAHLTSPTRRSTSMTPAELSAALLHRARQQAAKERLERIQELREKGIIIETAEERAAMKEDVENLMEKARQEAEEIAKREKTTSKGGESAGPDDEEDADLELSGSDEEEIDHDDGYSEDDGEDEDAAGAGFFENEADEANASDGGSAESALSDEEPEELLVSRRKRPTRVIMDDEDDEPELQAPETPARSVPRVPQSVARPHIPGLPTSDNLTMSLTQAFAGTLGESQPESSAALPSLPDPAHASDNFAKGGSQVMVQDSQDQGVPDIDYLGGYARSESRVSESPVPRSVSQFSQVPDPTQDAGFVYSPFDPNKRFMNTPPATVETVLVSHGSPVTLKTGRHLRRGRTAAVPESTEDNYEVQASAFDVMKKAAKKPDVPFDKTKSKAKDVVDEAAEESDDEYAGLGGASDDSEDEENEYDEAMINDHSGEVVDEKELAALNAMHQRATDEKQVAKLFKDLTTGALRRRRVADDDFDLDDSDDERLARRRRKQREFARMRKALLADERVGQLADNPKKAAFFKAIEDREPDDDVDLNFLDQEDGPQDDISSQDVAAPDQQAHAAGQGTITRKRPLEPSAEDITNRPPPHLRRAPQNAVSKRPSTLAEIRETVSFLTETPEYDSFRDDAVLDEEQPHEDRGRESEEISPETRSAEQQKSKDGFLIPRNPRRTRGPVVDRLALLRQASSNSASSASANSRLAFHAGSGSQSTINFGFRPPPLLRRSTTGSSSSSGTSSISSSTSRISKAPPVASLAKKGSVNYYTAAREKEREREIRSKLRGNGSNIAALLSKHAGKELRNLNKGMWE